MRRSHRSQRDAYLRPARRPSLRQFFYRHPRSLMSAVTALMAYVTIGPAYRVAQAHATVRSGWAAAVTIGLAAPTLLLALTVATRRRARSRRFLWSLYGVFGAWMIGFFAGNQSLALSGWARISYAVTSPVQVGTLAFLIPTQLALTALLGYTTWTIFTGRHPWTRRPAVGARPEMQVPTDRP